MTNVAAPLLAGFSIATVGVVSADGDKFRWPGAVLLCLTSAAFMFVSCLQLGFHARRHLYSWADITAWWAEDEVHDRLVLLREEQHADFQLWVRWRRRAHAAYSAGMVMLWAGVALALVPPVRSALAADQLRWAAVAVAVAGAVLEAVWTAYTPVRRWIRRRQALAGGAHE
ncbi:hypothetical protein [Streptomyces mirabilis]|uniref:hypothetical protein n=1 Tax=Streptomyces mirabilis TaxID=68239 RepID=UPI003657C202